MVGKVRDKSRSAGARRGRLLAARLVWTVALVIACFLAAGALLIALDANRGNGLVQFVLDVADGVDLGVFERDNGIFRFESGSEDSVETKNALVNWGLAAVVWLVVGRIAERLVRP